jgi:hypothetical protein
MTLMPRPSVAKVRGGPHVLALTRQLGDTWKSLYTVKGWLSGSLKGRVTPSAKRQFNMAEECSSFVMVVDDDADLRDTIIDALQDEQYRVVGAANAAPTGHASSCST